MPRLCTRCFRVTDEDMDTCPDKNVLGCPEPVEVSDEKAIIVKCDACPKIRAIPIGNIMQRKRLSWLGACVSDVCKAKIILPKAKPQAAVPAPIGEAKGGAGGKAK